MYTIKYCLVWPRLMNSWPPPFLRILVARHGTPNWFIIDSAEHLWPVNLHQTPPLLSPYKNISPAVVFDFFSPAPVGVKGHQKHCLLNSDTQIGQTATSAKVVASSGHQCCQLSATWFGFYSINFKQDFELCTEKDPLKPNDLLIRWSTGRSSTWLVEICSLHILSVKHSETIARSFFCSFNKITLIIKHSFNWAANHTKQPGLSFKLYQTILRIRP